MTPRTFAQNLETMSDISGVEKIVLQSTTGDYSVEIPNAEGKRGSLKLYYHILGGKNGTIGPVEATRAIELFAEYAAAARAKPGEHPNIDRLFPIADGRNSLEATIHYKA